MLSTRKSRTPPEGSIGKAAGFVGDELAATAAAVRAPRTLAPLARPLDTAKGRSSTAGAPLERRARARRSRTPRAQLGRHLGAVPVLLVRRSGVPRAL